jgi:hypothetical protein
MNELSSLSDKLKIRRGKSLHVVNPFIAEASTNTKTGVKRVSNKDGNRMMVVSETTGEIIAPAGFWHAQEVDKTRFVKLYVGGVKAFKDLTSAGTRVFEILYLEVQKNIGKDRVYMNFSAIDTEETKLSSATFNRGLKELISKEFIASTTTVGWYFLNPDYMFNGNRLAFVKTYRLESENQQKEDTKSIELFVAKEILKT